MLLLGANRSHLLTTQALSRAGLSVIGVNSIADPVARRGFASWWETDPASPDRLAALVRSESGVCAVLPTSEGEALAAIAIARDLKLPFPGEWPIDKWIQRTILNREPDLFVETHLLSTARHIRPLLDTKASWVIKPRVSRGGSRGVQLVSRDSLADLKVRTPETPCMGYQFIAEEVLPGVQITLDAVLKGGEVILRGLGHNVKQVGPSRVNTAIVYGGTVTEHWEASETMLRTMVQRLGLSNGLLHVEAAATPWGLRPIELAHRQGGGVVPDAVARISGRHPVVEAVQPNGAEVGAGAPAVVILYLIGRPGELSAPRFQPDPDDLRAAELPGIVDFMLFLPPDGCVKPLTSTQARLGHIVAVGDTVEEAVELALDASSLVTLTYSDGEQSSLLASPVSTLMTEVLW